jgi:hypothetical protein
MSPPVSTAVLEARIAATQKELDEHKTFTSNEIHELKASVRSLWKEVTRIEIKIAGWGVASGVITGVALKILDHLWK